MSLVEEAYQRGIDAMTPAEKIRRAEGLYFFARGFTTRQVQNENPGISEEELEREAARETYCCDQWMLELIDRATPVSPTAVFRPALIRIADTLRDVGIRFHVTGGLAACCHGDPRATADADLVIDGNSARERQDELLRTLTARRYLFDEAPVRDAVADGGRVRLLDSTVMFKVELFPRELIAGELDRSVDVEPFNGLTLPFTSLADLAVAKLVWISRRHHRSRYDVKQMLRRATDDEWAFVRKEAEERSLTGLLDEVLAEPDEIDA